MNPNNSERVQAGTRRRPCPLREGRFPDVRQIAPDVFGLCLAISVLSRGRMLGVKMGTGGSSGYFYLKASAEVRRELLEEPLAHTPPTPPPPPTPRNAAPLVHGYRLGYALVMCW